MPKSQTHLEPKVPQQKSGKAKVQDGDSVLNHLHCNSGVWLASMDLKDAYLHVPIAEEFHHYLRFLIQDQHLQFVVTPFGLSLAPYLFTRAVRVLVAWLRARGVHLYAYLDDILVVGASPEAVYHSLQMSIQVFTWAGFIINIKKSDLTLTQDLVYIGGRFRADLGMVFLPEDRREALIRVVFYSRGHETHSQDVGNGLGVDGSVNQTVKWAHLHMRLIQWHVKRH